MNKKMIWVIGIATFVVLCVAIFFGKVKPDSFSTKTEQYVYWEKSDYGTRVILGMRLDDYDSKKSKAEIQEIFQWPYGDSFIYLVESVNNKDALYAVLVNTEQETTNSIIKLSATHQEVVMENIQIGHYFQILGCDDNHIYYIGEINTGNFGIFKTSSQEEEILFHCSQYPYHASTIDGEKFVFETRSASGEKSVYYAEKNGELFLVDAGIFPCWLSDTQIGYVKEGILYQYDIETQEQGVYRTNRDTSIILKPDEYETERLIISSNREYLAYTIINADGLLERMGIENGQRKLVVISLKTGEEVKIVMQNYFFNDARMCEISLMQ